MRGGKTAIILAVIALVVIGGAAGAGLYALYQTHAAGAAGVPEAGPRGGGTVATELPPKQFGKWVLRCSLPKAGDKNCLLLMQVADQKSKRVLMRLVVAQNKGKTVLTVATPPNASLPDGVILTPDKGVATKADFAQCVPAACRAMHEMDEGFIAAISASTNMTAGYTAAGGQKVSYTLPVGEFAQALAALKAA